MQVKIVTRQGVLELSDVTEVVVAGSAPIFVATDYKRQIVYEAAVSERMTQFRQLLTELGYDDAARKYDVIKLPGS